MASIKVNSTVMREKSDILKGCSSSIKNFTEEMKNEIDRLRATWEGDVAETTIRKFNELSDDFEERYNTINQYATFLTNAADEWDRTNATNMQDIESKRS
ncbi:WXG100 family type VII secretion target [Vallitalea okinawensis]|uniref:WXG100 family type VII secretion target n=1 Tax=Vallitalea okinawensis TaxID=2078660 RepID=UPI001300A700|nr:WXG100 family type VII secretion target [Vallitalea okinawensis]